jgi:hypothetical protein
MAVYSNKKFVQQAAAQQKKKQEHNATWAQLCAQVVAFEDKEKKKQLELEEN